MFTLNCREMAGVCATVTNLKPDTSSLLRTVILRKYIYLVCSIQRAEDLSSRPKRPFECISVWQLVHAQFMQHIPVPSN